MSNLHSNMTLPGPEATCAAASFRHQLIQRMATPLGLKPLPTLHHLAAPLYASIALRKKVFAKNLNILGCARWNIHIEKPSLYRITLWSSCTISKEISWSFISMNSFCFATKKMIIKICRTICITRTHDSLIDWYFYKTCWQTATKQWDDETIC